MRLLLTFTVEFKLNITNCAKVRIFSEAFANTTFHGYFERIHDFQLLERAFSKSNARVTISNSRMDELGRLDASLKEIKFSNTHIGSVLTNAFDVFKIDSIMFENCHIDVIQTNAFTEKVCVIRVLDKFRIFRFNVQKCSNFGIFTVVQQSACVDWLQHWHDRNICHFGKWHQ